MQYQQVIDELPRCPVCKNELFLQPKQFCQGEIFDRTIKCFKCLALMKYTPEGLKLIRVMSQDGAGKSYKSEQITKQTLPQIYNKTVYGPELEHYKLFDTSRQNMMRMIKAGVIPDIDGRPIDIWVKDAKKKIAIMREVGRKKQIRGLMQYKREKYENR